MGLVVVAGGIKVARPSLINLAWLFGVAVVVILIGIITYGIWEHRREQKQIETARKKMLGATLADLDLMDGYQFEKWLLVVLERSGFQVELIRAPGDFGIDLKASFGPTSIGIQAKCYSGNVGNSAVQQAISGRQYHECHYAAVVTQSEFTNAAYEQARKANPPILLIGRSQLADVADILKGYLRNQ